MIFGRRPGEILFRPVESIELVLAGDPKPAENPWKTLSNPDSGDRFKSMYLGSWESLEEHAAPTYGAIERTVYTGMDFRCWPPSKRQLDAVKSPAKLKLYGGQRDPGKTWRGRFPSGARGLEDGICRDSVLAPNAGPRPPIAPIA